MKTLQNRIDELDYPPTHRYVLDGLEPLGPLKERLDLILSLDPVFFLGVKFLDIGCNKGFFSLLASKNFKLVTAVEPDRRYIDLCFDLKPDNMQLVHKSFRDFIPTLTYDKIFIGNTMHYMYIDSGWDWIAKLAVLSDGDVIIESPVGMECEDMQKIMPKDKQAGYNYNTFLEEMEKYFELLDKIPSPNHTPDRYIMRFKRKIKPQIQIKDLQNKTTIKTDQYTSIFYTEYEGKTFVCKIGIKYDVAYKNRIRMASLSPISNGIAYDIYDGDQFVGWAEEYKPSQIYGYYENQKELFKLICLDGIFLARNGYYEHDCGSLNFFKDDNRMFDKGSVEPIFMIIPLAVHYYFVQYEQSYNILTNSQKELLRTALLSKDSHKIEQAFKSIYDELNR